MRPPLAVTRIPLVRLGQAFIPPGARTPVPTPTQEAIVQQAAVDMASAALSRTEEHLLEAERSLAELEAAGADVETLREAGGRVNDEANLRDRQLRWLRQLQVGLDMIRSLIEAEELVPIGVAPVLIEQPPAVGPAGPMLPPAMPAIPTPPHAPDVPFPGGPFEEPTARVCPPGRIRLRPGGACVLPGLVSTGLTMGPSAAPPGVPTSYTFSGSFLRRR